MIVLRTKLHAPVERAPWVSRSRLMQKFSRNQSALVVVVLAPAGFGKTVAMAQWNLELFQKGHPTAWLSLDAGDNDEHVFLNHFDAALRPLLSVDNEQAQTLQSSPVLLTDAVIANLCNAMALLAEPATLFLDDFHLVSNQAVHRIVEQLIAADCLRLVIASRVTPPLPLGRLRMMGDLTEVGMEDLRFDAADASCFLANKLGPMPDTALVQAMVEQTEGWAAGLRLATLTLASGARAADPLTDFSGGNREVTEFLMQEVFAALDESLQDFLLRSAILERFSAQACRAILRRADAEIAIAAIEARHLFIMRLDAEGRWFRYHHLFRDFLRRQLERKSPEAIASLHLAAADWFFEQCSATDAVRHTLLAGDEKRAAGIVEACALPFIAECKFRQIEELLAQLPRSLVEQRIRLQLVIIWISVHSSQTRRGTAALARANALLEADPSCAADRGTLPPTSIEIELAVLDAAMASTCERFGEARDKALAVLRRLPVSAWFLLGVTYNIVGYNEYALGNIEAARRPLQDARRAHERSGSTLGLVITNCYLAVVERSAGRLDHAEALLRTAVAEAREQLGQGSYGEALASTILMEVAYETGQVVEAERLLESVRALIEGAVVVVCPLVSVPGYARLLRLKGRLDDALALLSRTDAGEDRIYLRLAAVALHEKIRLLLEGGLCGDARAALTRFRCDIDAQMSPVTAEFLKLAEIRVLLAEKQPEAARKMLELLVPQLRAGGRNRRLIVALMLLARCRPADETALLAEVLVLAKAGGFRRLLLDEGRALLARLSGLSAALARQHPEIADFANQLLAARPGLEIVIRPVENEGEFLTRREIDVLRHLCAGVSNRDLAGELALSEPTVKWHLKNIFGKLGVANRLQAVRAAQKRGLVG